MMIHNVAMRPCAVVAGASSGIGLATVRRLLGEGWNVATLARRKAPLVRLERGRRGRVLPLAVDVTQEEAVRRAAGAVADWQGRVDALVACAGDFLVAPIARTSLADFERIWRVTVLAKFLLAREFLPLLRSGKHPRAIVYVASLVAHESFPRESAYASAMHAVLGLAKSQDLELAPRGIRVAVVSPGLVRTPLTRRSGFGARLLERALAPADIAESIVMQVRTIRNGGYIPEIFHRPGRV